ncbi:MAG: hypothetical protein ACYDEN_14450 [Acidimicrobiales bacterium]
MTELLGKVNLYHPPLAGHNNSAISVAIVAAVIVGFTLVVVALASFGRRPPERSD